MEIYQCDKKNPRKLCTMGTLFRLAKWATNRMNLEPARTATFTYVALKEATLKRGLLCGSLLLGAILAINGDSFGGDGISYLDMGDALFGGHWKAILNGLWSPLYPALLGFTRYFIKSSMHWEPLTIQLANFAIYAAALFSFQFFWEELLKLCRVPASQHTRYETLSDVQFWILGYAIFLFVHLDSVTSTTPDMLLSSFVLLSSGLVIKIRLRGPSVRHSCLLGLSLGLGYLGKAVMLPLSGVFLAITALLTRPRRLSLSYSLVSLFVFVALVFPYIFEMSQEKGRFTLGEAGALNYGWHVNGLPFVHWHGGDPRFGRPVHPTRQIYSSPAVFEFATSDTETYPPWYAPSVWMEGFRLNLNSRDQFAALKRNLRAYLGILRTQGALVVGILVLWGTSKRLSQIPLEFLARWYVWGPAATAFVLYALVWVESRYLSPFLMLTWGAMLATVRLPKGRSSWHLVRLVTITVASILAIQTVDLTRKNMIEARELAKAEMQIAEGLSTKNILPGCKIAVIDAKLGEDWQKLLRVSVIAEIPAEEQEKFWSLAPAERARVFEVLQKNGSTALIVPGIPKRRSTDGWERIGNSQAYLRFLSHEPESSP